MAVDRDGGGEGGAESDVVSLETEELTFSEQCKTLSLCTA